MGSYSFFFSHHLNTMEGGMIVTDDEDLYWMLISLRSHGWSRGQPGASKAYEFIHPGYNVRPMEIQAAIGCEQLKKADSILASHRTIAESFSRAQDYGVMQTPIGSPSYFGISLLHKDVGHLKQRLEEDGHEFRPIVSGNIMNHPMMAYADVEHGSLDNAQYVEDHGVYIGVW